MKNKILAIAPHNDDEILGLGGSLLKHIDEGDDVFVCIVTRGYPPLFPEEGTALNKEETKRCHTYMGVSKTYSFELPAAMMETVERYKLNEMFVELIQEVKPDVVYIPHYGDMQKDHQMAVDAAMVALRPKYNHVVKRIYAYETLSETGWNVPNVQNEFIPNAYVDISAYLEKKLECMRFYNSQLADFPQARSLEAIEHLARYRGALMGMKAAEAFMIIRELR